MANNPLTDPVDHSVPVALFAGLTAFCLICAGWFSLETKLLAENKPPITWYTRNKLSNWGWWKVGIGTYIMGFVSGTALTHFIVDDPGGFDGYKIPWLKK
jgi:hypothetical protein